MATIHLADELRAVVGTSLDPDEFDQLFRAFVASLEETVGRRLADRLSDAQLEECRVLMDGGSSMMEFLEHRLPDYPTVVRRTVDEHLLVIAQARESGVWSAR